MVTPEKNSEGGRGLTRKNPILIFGHIQSYFSQEIVEISTQDFQE